MALGNWKPAHRVAFIFAALFGVLIGVFAGMGHFDPYENLYWLHVGEWGVIGALLGGLGGFLRQMLRGR